MRATCPDCGDDAEILDRRIGDVGGVVVDFLCPSCGNEWEIGF